MNTLFKRKILLRAKYRGIKDIDIDLATGRLLYSGSADIRKNVEKSILSLGYKIKNQ